MIRFAWKSGHLYAAADAVGDGACLLFFLPSAADGIPAELTADQAWDPAAGRLGTFLFLKALPGKGEWPALDEWAMATLAASSSIQTGFAWVSLDTAGPALAAALPLGRDAGGAVAEVETSIAMPLPLSAIPIPAGLRAVPRAGADGLDGVTLLPPPLDAARGQPASGPLNGTGLVLALSGPMRGCFLFQGVYNVESLGGGGATRTLDLYDVGIDPLVPWGGRTAMTITGVSVLLSDDGAAVILSPGDAGTG